MLFVIHCLDAADGTPRRMENYPAHKAHLERTAEFGIQIVMSGPLVKDDGESPIGSMFVIEAPNRAAVEKYQHGLATHNRPPSPRPHLSSHRLRFHRHADV